VDLASKFCCDLMLLRCRQVRAVVVHTFVQQSLTESLTYTYRTYLLW